MSHFLLTVKAENLLTVNSKVIRLQTSNYWEAILQSCVFSVSLIRGTKSKPGKTVIAQNITILSRSGMLNAFTASSFFMLKLATWSVWFQNCRLFRKSQSFYHSHDQKRLMLCPEL